MDDLGGYVDPPEYQVAIETYCRQKTEIDIRALTLLLINDGKEIRLDDKIIRRRV